MYANFSERKQSKHKVGDGAQFTSRSSGERSDFFPPSIQQPHSVAEDLEVAGVSLWPHRDRDSTNAYCSDVARTMRRFRPRGGWRDGSYAYSTSPVSPVYGAPDSASRSSHGGGKSSRTFRAAIKSQINVLLKEGWDGRTSLGKEAEAGRRSIEAQLSSPTYRSCDIYERSRPCLDTPRGWDDPRVKALMQSGGSKMRRLSSPRHMSPSRAQRWSRQKDRGEKVLRKTKREISPRRPRTAPTFQHMRAYVAELSEVAHEPSFTHGDCKASTKGCTMGVTHEASMSELCFPKAVAPGAEKECRDSRPVAAYSTQMAKLQGSTRRSDDLVDSFSSWAPHREREASPVQRVASSHEQEAVVIAALMVLPKGTAGQKVGSMQTSSCESLRSFRDSLESTRVLPTSLTGQHGSPGFLFSYADDVPIAYDQEDRLSVRDIAVAAAPPGSSDFHALCRDGVPPNETNVHVYIRRYSRDHSSPGRSNNELQSPEGGALRRWDHLQGMSWPGEASSFAAADSPQFGSVSCPRSLDSLQGRIRDAFDIYNGESTYCTPENGGSALDVANIAEHSFLSSAFQSRSSISVSFDESKIIRRRRILEQVEQLAARKATVITKVARGCAARRAILQHRFEHHSTVKIQQCLRQRIARLTLAEHISPRKSATRIQCLAHSKATRRESLTQRHLHVEVTKIQCRARSMLARAELNLRHQKKQAAVRLQCWVRSRKAVAEIAGMRARKRGTDECLAKEAEAGARQQPKARAHAAAIRIQCLVRRHAAKMEVESRHELRQHVQHRALREQAAKPIQAAARSQLARTMVRDVQGQKEAASTKIQSIGRKPSAKKRAARMGLERDAATMIKKTAKGRAQKAGVCRARIERASTGRICDKCGACGAPDQRHSSDEQDSKRRKLPESSMKGEKITCLEHCESSACDRDWHDESAALLSPEELLGSERQVVGRRESAAQPMELVRFDNEKDVSSHPSQCLWEGQAMKVEEASYPAGIEVSGECGDNSERYSEDFDLVAGDEKNMDEIAAMVARSKTIEDAGDEVPYKWEGDNTAAEGSYLIAHQPAHTPDQIVYATTETVMAYRDHGAPDESLRPPKPHDKHRTAATTQVHTTTDVMSPVLATQAKSVDAVIPGIDTPIGAVEEDAPASFVDAACVRWTSVASDKDNMSEQYKVEPLPTETLSAGVRLIDQSESVKHGSLEPVLATETMPPGKLMDVIQTEDKVLAKVMSVEMVSEAIAKVVNTLLTSVKHTPDSVPAIETIGSVVDTPLELEDTAARDEKPPYVDPTLLSESNNILPEKYAYPTLTPSTNEVLVAEGSTGIDVHRGDSTVSMIGGNASEAEEPGEPMIGIGDIYGEAQTTRLPWQFECKAGGDEPQAVELVHDWRQAVSEMMPSTCSFVGEIDGSYTASKQPTAMEKNVDKEMALTCRSAAEAEISKAITAAILRAGQSAAKEEGSEETTERQTPKAGESVIEAMSWSGQSARETDGGETISQGLCGMPEELVSGANSSAGQFAAKGEEKRAAAEQSAVRDDESMSKTMASSEKPGAGDYAVAVKKSLVITNDIEIGAKAFVGRPVPKVRVSEVGIRRQDTMVEESVDGTAVDFDYSSWEDTYSKRRETESTVSMDKPLTESVALVGWPTADDGEHEITTVGRFVAMDESVDETISPIYWSQDDAEDDYRAAEEQAMTRQQSMVESMKLVDRSAEESEAVQIVADEAPVTAEAISSISRFAEERKHGKRTMKELTAEEEGKSVTKMNVSTDCSAVKDEGSEAAHAELALTPRAPLSENSIPTYLLAADAGGCEVANQELTIATDKFMTRTTYLTDQFATEIMDAVEAIEEQASTPVEPVIKTVTATSQYAGDANIGEAATDGSISTIDGRASEITVSIRLSEAKIQDGMTAMGESVSRIDGSVVKTIGPLECLATKAEHGKTKIEKSTTSANGLESKLIFSNGRIVADADDDAVATEDLVISTKEAGSDTTASTNPPVTKAEVCDAITKDTADRAMGAVIDRVFITSRPIACTEDNQGAIAGNTVTTADEIVTEPVAMATQPAAAAEDGEMVTKEPAVTEGDPASRTKAPTRKHTAEFEHVQVVAKTIPEIEIFVDSTTASVRTSISCVGEGEGAVKESTINADKSGHGAIASLIQSSAKAKDCTVPMDDPAALTEALVTETMTYVDQFAAEPQDGMTATQESNYMAIELATGTTASRGEPSTDARDGIVARDEPTIDTVEPDHAAMASVNQAAAEAEEGEAKEDNSTVPAEKLAAELTASSAAPAVGAQSRNVATDELVISMEELVTGLSAARSRDDVNVAQDSVATVEKSIINTTASPSGSTGKIEDNMLETCCVTTGAGKQTSEGVLCSIPSSTDAEYGEVRAEELVTSMEKLGFEMTASPSPSVAEIQDDEAAVGNIASTTDEIMGGIKVLDHGFAPEGKNVKEAVHTPALEIGKYDHEAIVSSIHFSIEAEEDTMVAEELVATIEELGTEAMTGSTSPSMPKDQDGEAEIENLSVATDGLMVGMIEPARVFTGEFNNNMEAADKTVVDVGKPNFEAMVLNNWLADETKDGKEVPDDPSALTEELVTAIIESIDLSTTETRNNVATAQEPVATIGGPANSTMASTSRSEGVKQQSEGSIAELTIATRTFYHGKTGPKCRTLTEAKDDKMIPKDSTASTEKAVIEMALPNGTSAVKVEDGNAALANTAIAADKVVTASTASVGGFTVRHEDVVMTRDKPASNAAEPSHEAIMPILWSAVETDDGQMGGDDPATVETLVTEMVVSVSISHFEAQDGDTAAQGPATIIEDPLTGTTALIDGPAAVMEGSMTGRDNPDIKMSKPDHGAIVPTSQSAAEARDGEMQTDSLITSLEKFVTETTVSSSAGTNEDQDGVIIVQELTSLADKTTISTTASADKPTANIQRTETIADEPMLSTSQAGADGGDRGAPTGDPAALMEGTVTKSTASTDPSVEDVQDDVITVQKPPVMIEYPKAGRTRLASEPVVDAQDSEIAVTEPAVETDGLDYTLTGRSVTEAEGDKVIADDLASSRRRVMTETIAAAGPHMNEAPDDVIEAKLSAAVPTEFITEAIGSIGRSVAVANSSETVTGEPTIEMGGPKTEAIESTSRSATETVVDEGAVGDPTTSAEDLMAKITMLSDSSAVDVLDDMIATQGPPSTVEYSMSGKMESADGSTAGAQVSEMVTNKLVFETYDFDLVLASPPAIEAKGGEMVADDNATLMEELVPETMVCTNPFVAEPQDGKISAQDLPIIAKYSNSRTTRSTDGSAPRAQEKKAIEDEPSIEMHWSNHEAIAPTVLSVTEASHDMISAQEPSVIAKDLMPGRTGSTGGFAADAENSKLVTDEAVVEIEEPNNEAIVAASRSATEAKGEMIRGNHPIASTEESVYEAMVSLGKSAAGAQDNVIATQELPATVKGLATWMTIYTGGSAADTQGNKTTVYGPAIETGHRESSSTDRPGAKAEDVEVVTDDPVIPMEKLVIETMVSTNLSTARAQDSMTTAQEPPATVARSMNGAMALVSISPVDAGHSVAAPDEPTVKTADPNHEAIASISRSATEAESNEVETDALAACTEVVMTEAIVSNSLFVAAAHNTETVLQGQSVMIEDPTTDTTTSAGGSVAKAQGNEMAVDRQAVSNVNPDHKTMASTRQSAAEAEDGEVEAGKSVASIEEVLTGATVSIGPFAGEAVDSVTAEQSPSTKDEDLVIGTMPSLVGSAAEAQGNETAAIESAVEKDNPIHEAIESTSRLTTEVEDGEGAANKSATLTEKFVRETTASTSRYAAEAKDGMNVPQGPFVIIEDRTIDTTTSAGGSIAEGQEIEMVADKSIVERDIPAHWTVASAHGSAAEVKDKDVMTHELVALTEEVATKSIMSTGLHAAETAEGAIALQGSSATTLFSGQPAAEAQGDEMVPVEDVMDRGNPAHGTVASACRSATETEQGEVEPDESAALTQEVVTEAMACSRPCVAGVEEGTTKPQGPFVTTESLTSETTTSAGRSAAEAQGDETAAEKQVVEGNNPDHGTEASAHRFAVETEDGEIISHESLASTEEVVTEATGPTDLYAAEAAQNMTAIQGSPVIIEGHMIGTTMLATGSAAEARVNATAAEKPIVETGNADHGRRTSTSRSAAGAEDSEVMARESAASTEEFATEITMSTSPYVAKAEIDMTAPQSPSVRVEDPMIDATLSTSISAAEDQSDETVPVESAVEVGNPDHGMRVSPRRSTAEAKNGKIEPDEWFVSTEQVVTEVTASTSPCATEILEGLMAPKGPSSISEGTIVGTATSPGGSPAVAQGNQTTVVKNDPERDNPGHEMGASASRSAVDAKDGEVEPDESTAPTEAFVTETTVLTNPCLTGSEDGMTAPHGPSIAIEDPTTNKIILAAGSAAKGQADGTGPDNQTIERGSPDHGTGASPSRFSAEDEDDEVEPNKSAAPTEEVATEAPTPADLYAAEGENSMTAPQGPSAAIEDPTTDTISSARGSAAEGQADRTRSDKPTIETGNPENLRRARISPSAAGADGDKTEPDEVSPSTEEVMKEAKTSNALYVAEGEDGIIIQQGPSAMIEDPTTNTTTSAAGSTTNDQENGTVSDNQTIERGNPEHVTKRSSSRFAADAEDAEVEQDESAALTGEVVMEPKASTLPYVTKGENGMTAIEDSTIDTTTSAANSVVESQAEETAEKIQSIGRSNPERGTGESANRSATKDEDGEVEPNESAAPTEEVVNEATASTRSCAAESEDDMTAPQGPCATIEDHTTHITTSSRGASAEGQADGTAPDNQSIERGNPEHGTGASTSRSTANAKDGKVEPDESAIPTQEVVTEPKPSTSPHVDEGEGGMTIPQGASAAIEDPTTDTTTPSLGSAAKGQADGTAPGNHTVERGNPEHGTGVLTSRSTAEDEDGEVQQDESAASTEEVVREATASTSPYVAESEDGRSVPHGPSIAVEDPTTDTTTYVHGSTAEGHTDGMAPDNQTVEESNPEYRTGALSSRSTAEDEDGEMEPDESAAPTEEVVTEAIAPTRPCAPEGEDGMPVPHGSSAVIEDPIIDATTSAARSAAGEQVDGTALSNRTITGGSSDHGMRASTSRPTAETEDGEVKPVESAAPTKEVVMGATASTRPCAPEDENDMTTSQGPSTAIEDPTTDTTTSAAGSGAKDQMDGTVRSNQTIEISNPEHGIGASTSCSAAEDEDGDEGQDESATRIEKVMMEATASTSPHAARGEDNMTTSPSSSAEIEDPTTDKTPSDRGSAAESQLDGTAPDKQNIEVRNADDGMGVSTSRSAAYAEDSKVEADESTTPIKEIVTEATASNDLYVAEGKDGMIVSPNPSILIKDPITETSTSVAGSGTDGRAEETAPNNHTVERGNPDHGTGASTSRPTGDAEDGELEQDESAAPTEEVPTEPKTSTPLYVAKGEDSMTTLDGPSGIIEDPTTNATTSAHRSAAIAQANGSALDNQSVERSNPEHGTGASTSPFTAEAEDGEVEPDKSSLSTEKVMTKAIVTTSPHVAEGENDMTALQGQLAAIEDPTTDTTTSARSPAAKGQADGMAANEQTVERGNSEHMMRASTSQSAIETKNGEVEPDEPAAPTEEDMTEATASTSPYVTEGENGMTLPQGLSAAIEDPITDIATSAIASAAKSLADGTAPDNQTVERSNPNHVTRASTSRSAAETEAKDSEVEPDESAAPTKEVLTRATASMSPCAAEGEDVMTASQGPPSAIEDPTTDTTTSPCGSAAEAEDGEVAAVKPAASTEVVMAEITESPCLYADDGAEGMIAPQGLIVMVEDSMIGMPTLTGGSATEAQDSKTAAAQSIVEVDNPDHGTVSSARRSTAEIKDGEGAAEEWAASTEKVIGTPAPTGRYTAEAHDDVTTMQGASTRIDQSVIHTTASNGGLTSDGQDSEVAPGDPIASTEESMTKTTTSIGVFAAEAQDGMTAPNMSTAVFKNSATDIAVFTDQSVTKAEVKNIDTDESAIETDGPDRDKTAPVGRIVLKAKGGTVAMDDSAASTQGSVNDTAANELIIMIEKSVTRTMTSAANPTANVGDSDTVVDEPTTEPGEPTHEATASKCRSVARGKDSEVAIDHLASIGQSAVRAQDDIIAAEEGATMIEDPVTEMTISTSASATKAQGSKVATIESVMDTAESQDDMTTMEELNTTTETRVTRTTSSIDEFEAYTKASLVAASEQTVKIAKSDRETIAPISWTEVEAKDGDVETDDPIDLRDNTMTRITVSSDPPLTESQGDITTMKEPTITAKGPVISMVAHIDELAVCIDDRRIAAVEPTVKAGESDREAIESMCRAAVEVDHGEAVIDNPIASTGELMNETIASSRQSADEAQSDRNTTHKPIAIAESLLTGTMASPIEFEACAKDQEIEACNQAVDTAEPWHDSIMTTNRSAAEVEGNEVVADDAVASMEKTVVEAMVSLSLSTTEAQDGVIATEETTTAVKSTGTETKTSSSRFQAFTEDREMVTNTTALKTSEADDGSILSTRKSTSKADEDVVLSCEMPDLMEELVIMKTATAFPSVAEIQDGKPATASKPFGTDGVMTETTTSAGRSAAKARDEEMVAYYLTIETDKSHHGTRVPTGWCLNNAEDGEGAVDDPSTSTEELRMAKTAPSGSSGTESQDSMAATQEPISMITKSVMDTVPSTCRPEAQTEARVMEGERSTVEAGNPGYKAVASTSRSVAKTEDGEGAAEDPSTSKENLLKQTTVLSSPSATGIQNIAHGMKQPSTMAEDSMTSTTASVGGSANKLQDNDIITGESVVKTDNLGHGAISSTIVCTTNIEDGEVAADDLVASAGKPVMEMMTSSFQSSTGTQDGVTATKKATSVTERPIIHKMASTDKSTACLENCEVKAIEHAIEIDASHSEAKASTSRILSVIVDRDTDPNDPVVSRYELVTEITASTDLYATEAQNDMIATTGSAATIEECLPEMTESSRESEDEAEDSVVALEVPAIKTVKYDKNNTTPASQAAAKDNEDDMAAEVSNTKAEELVTVKITSTDPSAAGSQEDKTAVEDALAKVDQTEAETMAPSCESAACDEQGKERSEDLSTATDEPVTKTTAWTDMSTSDSEEDEVATRGESVIMMYGDGSGTMASADCSKMDSTDDKTTIEKTFTTTGNPMITTIGCTNREIAEAEGGEKTVDEPISNTEKSTNGTTWPTYQSAADCKDGGTGTKDLLPEMRALASRCAAQAAYNNVVIQASALIAEEPASERTVSSGSSTAKTNGGGIGAKNSADITGGPEAKLMASTDPLAPEAHDNGVTIDEPPDTAKEFGDQARSTKSLGPESEDTKASAGRSEQESRNRKATADNSAITVGWAETTAMAPVDRSVAKTEAVTAVMKETTITAESRVMERMASTDQPIVKVKNSEVAAGENLVDVKEVIAKRVPPIGPCTAETSRDEIAMEKPSTSSEEHVAITTVSTDLCEDSTDTFRAKPPPKKWLTGASDDAGAADQPRLQAPRKEMGSELDLGADKPDGAVAQLTGCLVQANGVLCEPTDAVNFILQPAEKAMYTVSNDLTSTPSFNFPVEKSAGGIVVCAPSIQPERSNIPISMEPCQTCQLQTSTVVSEHRADTTVLPDTGMVTDKAEESGITMTRSELETGTDLPTNLEDDVLLEGRRNQATAGPEKHEASKEEELTWSLPAVMDAVGTPAILPIESSMSMSGAEIDMEAEKAHEAPYQDAEAVVVEDETETGMETVKRSDDIESIIAITVPSSTQCKDELASAQREGDEGATSNQLAN